MTTTINPTTHLTAINPTHQQTNTQIDTDPQIVRARPASNPAVVRRTRAAGISIGRLIRVETRKFLDTRSGQVLLAVAVALAVLIGSLVAYYFKSVTADFHTTQWWVPMLLMNEPFRILLPVMAVLLVTTEWSQRTALTTFTLEPRRGRVLIAKAAVLVVMAIAATTLLLGTSAIFSIIGGAHAGVDVGWGISRIVLIPLVALLVTMLMGFGLGLATMNTPAAVVTTVALPTISLFMIGIGGRAEQIVNWVDLQTALRYVLASGATQIQWTRFAVAATIWIIIPITVGVIRHLRIEVK